MQSMFRLPWSSDSPGDKIMEKAALHKPSRNLNMPVVDIPLLSTFKRKRTDSPEVSSPAHLVKKQKCANGEVKPAADACGPDRLPVVDGILVSHGNSKAQPKAAANDTIRVATSRVGADVFKKEAPPQPKPTAQLSATPKPSLEHVPAMETSQQARLTPTQQALEAQFNYEILLKHNELRLIEQELGKCQVALEQLRRCQLMPYPGSHSLSENVSRGVGPALQPRRGYSVPMHAAPWGVTDGPYTRHYAKWLIPDPKFDSVPQSGSSSSQGYFGLGEGRATRGSFTDTPAVGKSRNSRTSTGAMRFQSLGENPAPVPKVDPLLHKRSTDGQWVRLYCALCASGQFSNTQGFLNHCRIKHNQIYKSHDAAAVACGVPVETDDLGSVIPPSEQAQSVPPTPLAGFVGSVSNGFGHSLIRSNAPAPAPVVPPRLLPSAAAPARSEDAVSSGTQSPLAQSPFVPSPQTPYMNALLQKRGFPGTYKNIVDIARTRVDFSSIETSDDEAALDSALQTPVSKVAPQLARLPVSNSTLLVNGKAPAHPTGSKKGHNRVDPPRLPRVGVNGDVNCERSFPDSPVELSPNTVESNPGLVSDHEDDDEDDDADARSVPQLDREGDYVMDDAIVVEYASEGEAERQTRKGLGAYENGKSGGSGTRKR
jgi:ADA HAT complex component 1